MPNKNNISPFYFFKKIEEKLRAEKALIDHEYSHRIVIDFAFYFPQSFQSLSKPH